MKTHEEETGLQRQRLGEWLETWQMHLRLEALADPPEPRAPPGTQVYPPSVRPPEAAGSDAPGHKEHLDVGSIVLLPPDNEATRSRPVYVALASALRGGRWLAVPFGRFHVPGLPGEMATGHAAAPLQVLCAWNRAPVAAQRLRCGWLIGRLNALDLRWLRQLIDLPPGQRPSRALARRLGPPLVHPLDPRHDYIEEERMIWFAAETPSRCGESAAPYHADNDEILPQAADEVDDTYRDKP